jgi:hypothetical protein
MGYLIAAIAICLWVAGNRLIRNGGRYTTKYWGLGLVAFSGVTLVLGLAGLAGETSLARTPEPKGDSLAQASPEHPVAAEPKAKNKLSAEMFVDFTESHYPGTIEGICLSYDKFGDDAWRAAFAKGYDERVKSYAQQLPTAEEFLAELLSRCTV